VLVLREQIESAAASVDEDPAQPGACDGDPCGGARRLTRRPRRHL
jgi:hypothetical protein